MQIVAYRNEYWSIDINQTDLDLNVSYFILKYSIEQCPEDEHARLGCTFENIATHLQKKKTHLQEQQCCLFIWIPVYWLHLSTLNTGKCWMQDLRESAATSISDQTNDLPQSASRPIILLLPQTCRELQPDFQFRGVFCWNMFQLPYRPYFLVMAEVYTLLNPDKN